MPAVPRWNYCGVCGVLNCLLTSPAGYDAGFRPNLMVFKSRHQRQEFSKRWTFAKIGEFCAYGNATARRAPGLHNGDRNERPCGTMAASSDRSDGTANVVGFPRIEAPRDPTPISREPNPPTGATGATQRRGSAQPVHPQSTFSASRCACQPLRLIRARHDLIRPAKKPTVLAKSWPHASWISLAENSEGMAAACWSASGSSGQYLANATGRFIQSRRAA